MKTKFQYWSLLGSLFVLGFVSPLAGQLTPEETEDSRDLVRAVNAGEYVTALEILRGYGITNGTLEGMAAHLGRPAPRVTLQEPFLKGYLLMEKLGQGHKVYRRVRDAQAINYPTPLWVADNLNMRGWGGRCDYELTRLPVPPIAVLNLRMPDAQVIRYFQWYNRYAERLHSVGLNWYHLNNFDVPDHAGAFQVLNALHQLIKARKPDAFTWLLVERAPDNSDIPWVQTMRLGYDGLMVGNLREFRGSYAVTRQRYLPYVGEATPMVLTGFYGCEKPLLKAAETDDRGQALLRVGEVLSPELGRMEKRIWDLGYRGLVVDWRVVAAVAKARGVATN
jgi:hypothetical protein